MRLSIAMGTLLLASLMGQGAGIAPKCGGVCFRFDDNQTSQRWSEMTGVFDRHGQKLCMSLNLYGVGDPAFFAVLKKAQDSGHELMDHTPTHSVFHLRCSDAAAAAAFRGNPAVDHVQGRAVNFKYIVHPEAATGSFKAAVDGNRLDLAAADATLLGWRNFTPFVFVVAPDGKAYAVAKSKDGVFSLKSFWFEDNVDLGKLPALEFKVMDSGRGFSVDHGALRLQAELTRKLFAERGLKPPTTWIQPGCGEPLTLVEDIRDVLGREFGYQSAATYPAASLKCFDEPDPDGLRRYAMMWGDFSLEREDVAAVKRKIADGAAKHHVLFATSHMISQGVPGGWEEFLRRHDELLKWCREAGVPVRTQSQWADILYAQTPDSAENVIPALDVDRDGDGVPDGFVLAPGVTKGDGPSLVAAKPGNIFAITKLAGLEKGANTFRFNLDGPAGAEVQATLRPAGGKATSFTARLDAQGGREFSLPVEVPATTASMDVAMDYKSGAGPLKVGGLSFSALPPGYCRQTIKVDGSDLELSPLPNGARWAMTTRWDDGPACDKKMADLLEKHGFKGSFYVVTSRPEASKGLERDLLSRGHAVQSHSVTHARLPFVTLSQAWDELLRARIDLETRTDHPVNSFAFPGHAWGSQTNPDAQDQIYELIVRTGYNNLPWPRPRRMGELSGAIPLPADGAPVDEAFKRLLQNQDARDLDPNITWTCHASAYEKAASWGTLDEQLRSHAKLDGFWYCTHDDYGAYRYQYTHSRLRRIDAQTYELIRPAAVLSGGDIPLELRFSGSSPKVEVDGRSVVATACPPDGWRFQVPGVSASPRLIGAAKFPWLQGELALSRDRKRLEFSLKNNGAEVMRDVLVTWRLPLPFTPGVVMRTVGELDAGNDWRGDVALVPGNVPAGTLFAVQVDFRSAGTVGRAYYLTLSPPAP